MNITKEKMKNKYVKYREVSSDFDLMRAKDGKPKMWTIQKVLIWAGTNTLIFIVSCFTLEK
jgi:hypothetical protein